MRLRGCTYFLRRRERGWEAPTSGKKPMATKIVRSYTEDDPNWNAAWTCFRHGNNCALCCHSKRAVHTYSDTSSHRNSCVNDHHLIVIWESEVTPSIKETTGFEARANERSARYSDLKKRICGLGFPGTCPTWKPHNQQFIPRQMQPSLLVAIDIAHVLSLAGLRYEAPWCLLLRKMLCCHFLGWQ